MKKLLIAMFAMSSMLVSTPAFSATQAEVVASCSNADCVAAVKAFLQAIPAGQRAAAARGLAAALAQAGVTAGAAKANFTAALSAVSEEVAGIDPALSQQVAQLSDTLGGGGAVDTAALGDVAASAN